jgi:suppressor of fused-like protein
MDFAPGLVALQEYLASKNPSEPDPLVIRRAGIPHWLGGYEALDGIFVYSIPKSSQSPAYYHYITAGLSDLYGDGRVRFPVFENLSGFGIELTLKVEKSESSGIPH